MSINITVINNVSDEGNCKRDNINSSEVVNKAINRRKRTDNCGKTFEEILENAQAVILVDDFKKEFDEVDDVLEDVLSLKDLSIEASLSSIESMSSNKELEETLGVSPDYYRKRYFELLKIIALYTDIK